MRGLAGGRREPDRRPGLTSADDAIRQTSDDVKSAVSDDVEQDDELEQESMSAAAADVDRMSARVRVREQTTQAQTGSPTTSCSLAQVSTAQLASDGGSRSPHRRQTPVEDVVDGGG